MENRIAALTGFQPELVGFSFVEPTCPLFLRRLRAGMSGRPA